MSNNSQSMSFNAGQAKGQTQEKASNLVDKASNAAQSAKESLQEGGQQLKQKAQGASEAIKDKTGINN
ncbi:PREDICTED: late embryogenesis abundant protein 2-like [Camelina sativa]|uniref:Late embryogenesis abundant protein 2-like n=1 Tax=Camelina sativa TaxID=90675 RepID=A0ABM1R9X0_CAMSA|nr:PREDICTED: late embryogenesis abundant protein 2-like [Camelina sativa]